MRTIDRIYIDGAFVKPHGIERLELVPYALPFREPYVTARGRLDRRRARVDSGR